MSDTKAALDGAIRCVQQALSLLDEADCGRTAAPHIDLGLTLLVRDAEAFDKVSGPAVPSPR